ncbi:Uncharacterized protein CPn_0206/CP_0561/CPj0206/CpB0210 [Chlamydiales bacterium SCGC AG-110-P3]|nr:Uncharacterized protein CPn_0206/CP_0561/CPj0206/CpB0210 [Chlamydiales bacterium SCGC AG-110-P3]
MIQAKLQLAQYVLKATENYTGFFPARAVRAAREECEELIPELIKRVDFAVDSGKALSENYMGHLFAIYLLAEFRAEKAYETMLRMFSLDGDALEVVLGDTLTEGLGSIVASVAQGRYKDLLALFENSELYEFARLAALSAVEIQMHEGLIDRPEIEKQLGRILSSAIEAEDVVAITALIGTVCTLKIEQLADAAREAFDRDLVDKLMIGRDYFERIIRTGDYGGAHYEQLVVTAEESMSWWHCFESDADHTVSRNVRCPCGSGLKSKRCCFS